MLHSALTKYDNDEAATDSTVLDDALSTLVFEMKHIIAQDDPVGEGLLREMCFAQSAGENSTHSYKLQSF